MCETALENTVVCLNSIASPEARTYFNRNGFKSIAVCLKSSRRRRERTPLGDWCETYRCVPKIASSEARQNIIVQREGEVAAGRSAYLRAGREAGGR